MQSATGLPAVYEIRLQGRLSVEWSDWFDSLTIAYDEEGNTLLTCFILDQAALHGILERARDLNLMLLSVRRI